MLIGNAIGIGMRCGGGGIAEWLAQNASKFLFFGETSKITGGKLYNQKSGATDWLTVAGSAGSETYQAPNTAAYIAADTDYIWFKTDTTLRTVTTAELVGYDLQRTPVKFGDNAPYAIDWIAIMEPTATFTATELNQLFQYFELPVEWHNDTNAYGHIKGNRTGQNLWVPESVYEAETVALIARLSGSPTTAMKDLIDVTIKSLKANGGATKYWNRMDVISFLNLDATGNLLNWKTNANNPSLVGSPTFTAKLGITVNGTDAQYVNTNFKPFSQGVNYTQDNASYVIMKNVATSKDGYFGNYEVGKGLVMVGDSNDAVAHTRVNDNGGSGVVCVRITDYTCANREDVSNRSVWIDDVLKSSGLVDTVTLADKDVWLGSCNGFSANIDGRFVFYSFGSKFADKTDLDGFLTIIRYFNLNIGGTF